MFIPYSTDAPIYHWPYATLGTIIANVLAFCGIFVLFLQPGDANAERAQLIFDTLILQYGTWKPWQWVTSNYMHAGPMHLIGNMIILWAFGIIVEGKIGWWQFLLLYNGIGILECGVEQTLMIFAQEGGSLGASAIIYGLIAIAMVWAPANDLRCFLLLGVFSRAIDVSILTYAGVSLAIEFLFGGISVLSAVSNETGVITAISSEIIHLMGAALGFGVGVGMLRLGWVDCENWDLFSVLKNRHTLTKEQLQEEALNSPQAKHKLANLRESMLAQFRNYLSADEPAAALAVHRRAKVQFPDWRLAEPEHVQLVQLLRKKQLWDDTVLVMVEYLTTYAERAPLVRLALGQLLVEQLSRPMQALKVLAKLDPKLLPPPQQQKFAALRKRATAETDDNPFEAVVDDW